ncbi:hypothetical protein EV122DRAFT_285216 [Schizophyllum commune]
MSPHVVQDVCHSPNLPPAGTQLQRAISSDPTTADCRPRRRPPTSPPPTYLLVYFVVAVCYQVHLSPPRRRNIDLCSLRPLYMFYLDYPNAIGLLSLPAQPRPRVVVLAFELALTLKLLLVRKLILGLKLIVLKCTLSRTTPTR